MGRALPRYGDTVSQIPIDQTKEPPARPSEDGVSQKTDQVTDPAISAYFGTSKVSPSAFIKALKAAKVKRFTQSDESQASELLDKNDSNGERLWALMSQTSLPEAVDRWIWMAAQDRLKVAVGGNFDPLSHDTVQILHEMRNSLGPNLRSKQKGESDKAGNWLRIGICWLIEKRSLTPWLIAEQIRSILFKDQLDAARTAVRVLQRGRWTEFRQAVAMTGLAQTMLEGARRERDNEIRTSVSLREQLSDSLSEIGILRSNLVTLNQELATKSEALSNTQSQLDSERQHWGHDLSETKAEQRVLLRERVTPLLSDAIDALEIDPAAPHIALKRLKTVLSIINHR
jgi:hypothetical protein